MKLYWRSMSKKPKNPILVVFCYSKYIFTNTEGQVADAGIEIDAVRHVIGFWDGIKWREAGTCHEIDEFKNTPADRLPTHWAEFDGLEI